MSNVLSQEEIDALLNAMSSGEEPETEDDSPQKGEVRPYDFRDANKFPKEQIRTLESVFDSFAQLLANQLTGTLRAPCTIKVMAIEEELYREFNGGVPSPAFLAILNMPPMEGSVMMMITPDIAYAMINRVFGGAQDDVDTSKSFTEIELVVLERLAHQFMGLLDESWTKVVEIDASIDRIETSAQFAQIVALTEPVAIISLEITIGDTPGLISFCIPHLAIEPIAQQLSTKLWYTANTSRNVEPRGEDIQSKLKTSQVTVKAVFNETPASIRDILCLQVGDVVQLNHRVDACINLTVEEVPKFSGVIGVRGSHYAVQVVDILSEEEENERYSDAGAN